MRKLPLVAWIVTALLPGVALAQSNAYVTNQGLSQVDVFRTSDWVSLGSITVGSAPTGISIPSTGGFAYVANRGSNTVSRIDLATSTVTATIPVPGNPTQVAVSPNGTKAYVVQSTNCPPLPTPTPAPVPTPTPDPALPTPSPTPPPPCTVAVIDTASDTVTGSVTVGHDPFAVAFSTNGGFAYVTNRSDDTLSVIDATTDLVVQEVPVGDTPEGVAVGAGEIYVANDAANTVTVIREVDLQIEATLGVGGGPLGLGIAPDGETALVSNDADGSVSIMAPGTHTVTGTVATDSHPTGIAFLPDSSKAVVANNNGSMSIVTLLDGSVWTIPIVGSPSGVAITPEPFFTLSKSALPYQVETGTNVTFTLSYTNKGSGVATGTTITDPIPHPELTFVSATGGGTVAGTDVVWSLPVVAAGESGAVQVVFTAGALIADGTLVTNVATITDSLGREVSAEAPIRIRTPGSIDLLSLYKKVPPERGRGDTVRFRMRITPPATFTGAEQVDVRVEETTTAALLYDFTIPAGQLQVRGQRYKYRGVTASGAKVRFMLTPDRIDGFYRVRFQATKATLPLSPSPSLRITLNLGPDVISTQRVFDVHRAPPGGQRLFYQD